MRLGLKQTVIGKAKEVARALTGNDSLTTEGCLDQEQARQNGKADTLSHMAEAESEEAVEQLDAVREAGQQEREAVQQRTEAAESQAEREARVRKQAAELEFQENVVREQSTRPVRPRLPNGRHAARRTPKSRMSLRRSQPPTRTTVAPPTTPNAHVSRPTSNAARPKPSIGR